MTNNNLKRDNTNFDKELKSIKNQIECLNIHKEKYNNKEIKVEDDLNNYKKMNITSYDIHYKSIDTDRILSSFISKNHSSNDKFDNEKLMKFFNDKKNDLMSNFNKKCEIIETLKNKNNKLEEINAEFKIRLHEYEEEKKFFCKNCYLNFKNKEEDEQLCYYHTGEIKYYSCKECGGDDYYSCCFKCNKCSRGCKKSNHVYVI